MTVWALYGKGNKVRLHVLLLIKCKGKPIRLLKKTIFERYFLNLRLILWYLRFCIDEFPKNVYVGEHRRSTTGDTAEKVHQVCKYEIHEDYDSETDSSDIGKSCETEKVWPFLSFFFSLNYIKRNLF